MKWLLFVALVLCFVRPSSSEANDVFKATNSKISVLTLEQYLHHFLNSDPGIQLAELEQKIALLEVQSSRDRLRLKANLHSPLGYEWYTLDNQQKFKRTAKINNATVKMDDFLGGTLQANAHASLVSKPKFTEGGNKTGGSISYTIPLWRNGLGQLYQLETAYLIQSQQAKAIQVEAALLERCVAGIEIFIHAYLLQEQEAIWRDLLEHKERTYKQTVRDHGRRMLTKLDFLSAKSDWLNAKQRFESFLAQKLQALEILSSYFTTKDNFNRLTSPVGFFKQIPSSMANNELAALTVNHPRTRVYDKEASALQAQTVFVEQSYLPEISLGPQVGVEYMSHVFTGTQYDSLTNSYALLGISVDFPLIEPTPDYQTNILSIRLMQVQKNKLETIRFLTEQTKRALLSLKAIEAKLELTEEKLKTIQAQLKEASSLYGAGRLEFQDYLQHWTFYEQTKFEQLELIYSRWTAQTALLSSLGNTPKICQESR